MALNFLDFTKIVSDSRSTIDFLRDRNILHKEMYCCNELCSLVGDTYGSSDKQIFSCKVCFKRHSIRKNSFFSRSKLSLQVLLSLLYYFSVGSSVSNCCKILIGSVTKKTVVQWYNYFRDVMTTYLATNPVRFSRNCVINVDETAVGGCRKYQRGRIPRVQTRWLFGLVCSFHHKIYCEFIEDKSHESIIPLITRHVEQGATIHSDGANVYKCLRNMNYTYDFVVHEREFVNRITGTHTNYIENVWSNLKIHLKGLRGSQGPMLDGHVDEFIYRYNRKNKGNMFNLLVSDIADQYPV